MKNKIVMIVLAIFMSINMYVCTYAAVGLCDKPDVTDFSYSLKDRNGISDTVISSGGTLEVNLTLENNTADKQPYVVMLQILKEGNKVSLKSAEGEIVSSNKEIVCLSDAFPSYETDFSKYSAEVYVWSDMTTMQPISTYSVFGSDNSDIYAYKIDNDLVYTKDNTFLSHYFAKDYTGTPNIRPVFYDLGAKCAAKPVIEEVTTSKQSINFKTLSQLGSQKDYYLEIFKVTDETDPKNADLKSITLPMGAYNSNYNGISNLYPAFDKDITEYTVVTYMKPYAGQSPAFETVNSDASVALTTAPDTTLSNTTAVYTVTSADGSVTKDYTFNYIASRGTTLSITDIRNGYQGSGECYYSWYRGKNDPLIDADEPNIVIQNGMFGTRTIKDTRPIIEIDISDGPEEIKYGVLTLSKTKDINTANTDGTLRLCKIDDRIYNVGDITTIPQTDVPGYFGDELCSVNIGLKTSNNGDMYYINIGSDYYNSLKSAGKTKMYIGLAGEASDSSKTLCSVFGRGGGDSEYTKSRFHAITE